MMRPCVLVGVLLIGSLTDPIRAQVSFERLANADQEPQNWLTYSGGYSSHRYSLLRQIDLTNVTKLEQKWVLQAQTSLENFTASPLVADGVMYVTLPVNDVVAVDAATGRVFWSFSYSPSTKARPCCGAVNRGLAILGETLFLATLDGHLVALDAKTGRAVWNTTVADIEKEPRATFTVAPLVVKDKVILGVSGGDAGLRGFIAAYDAHTGKETWRFYTIPDPGEPGGGSWPGPRGGAGVWVTGSYDPGLNLTYWGTGNPWPSLKADQRKSGDNLYSDCVVALDVDTGKLRWHFQFTPTDLYDYDATQIPVLIDAEWNGSPRKLMLWANRNGYFYVLDRATGKFLSGRPFVKVNWSSGLDADGRPIRTRQPDRAPTSPGIEGGTNWYSPSYSPRTGLFYVTAWEDTASFFDYDGTLRPFVPVPGAPPRPYLRRGLINTWTDTSGHAEVTALDPRTGQKKWQFKMTDVSSSGILTTASDLLFTGGREGYFHALDARNGRVLWKTSLGGQIVNGPISYQADGKQYVAVAAGHCLFVFALRE